MFLSVICPYYFAEIYVHLVSNNVWKSYSFSVCYIYMCVKLFFPLNERKLVYMCVLNFLISSK